MSQVPGVMEIFSPPRVCPQAPQYGMRDLGSFDKVTGWDARVTEDMQDLWDRIEMEEPFCIIMSPPCEKLTALQNLTPDEKRKDLKRHLREVLEAKRFVLGCVRIAEYQMSRDLQLLPPTVYGL